MTKEAMVEAAVARLREDIHDLIRFVPENEWPKELVDIRKLILKLQTRKK